MSEQQPTRVQRYPRGYLGQLGAQTAGTTPQSAGELILPIIDVRPYLAFGSVKHAVTNINLAAVGNNSIAGPGSAAPWASEQVWAVHGWTIRSSAALGAGTTIRATLGLTVNSGTQNLVVGDTVSFTVGEFATWGVWFDEPIIIGPNEQVAIFVNAFAGLNTACTGHVRYVALESQ